MVLTRVLKRICRKRIFRFIQLNQCHGFKILPTTAFYAIHWSRWQQFFDANSLIINKTLELLDSSIALHVWNKFSANYSISKTDPKSVYIMMAEKNCPRCYDASGTYF